MSAADSELRRKLTRLRRAASATSKGRTRSSESAGTAEPPDDGPPARDEARRSDAARSGRPGSTLPVWLAARLRARAGSGAATPMSARSGAPVATGAPGVAADPGPAALAERSPDPPAELVVEQTAEGTVTARNARFGPRRRHGTWRLDEAGEGAPSELALLARDPALERLEPRHAVYLDIETTGLSGGAGTIPFMVGLGRFGASGFELWQGFLRGPEEERALLFEVARRVRESRGVVSFFGKSFDRHRLEDKMRVHGIASPFEAVPHLDLYHPLARLYREALPDTRLATMESTLCGVRRTDDLPGSFAPEAWFDFLAGRPHRLEAVFRHNLDDVLSLATLTGHLSRCLSERRASGASLGEALPGRPVGGAKLQGRLAGARARALGRLFAERRQRARARVWIDRALARGGADPRPWLVLRADSLRLDGAVEAALAEYELLVAEEDEHAVHCWVQIAKLCEHRLGDPERARAAVAAGSALLERLEYCRRRGPLARDLERRAERLGERCTRGARPARPQGS